jgi:Rod binding domain-containing protein
VTDLAIMPPLADIQTTPLPDGTGHKPGDPARIRDAAQQFEALLLGEMMRSARESTGNWLSNGDDSSGDCATDFAEQQFAAAMAQQGGLGLAALITEGLTRP